MKLVVAAKTKRRANRQFARRLVLLRYGLPYPVKDIYLIIANAATHQVIAANAEIRL